ncbi:MAG TPA: pyridoxal-phosphate dependent enzyme [Longimicrobium sp.]|jgi:threonine dehydratase
MNEPRISSERIAAAAREIDPVFTGTPQFEVEALGRELGFRLVCKVETMNPVRSFKGRGADFFVRGLAEGEPLVCASAGNFGQALAYAARRRAIPVTVFAAETANPLKLAQMRALGATVRLWGADLDEAKDRARAFASESGQRFVEDGREVAISEGAGTLALELCRWPEPIGTVLVPLGNGALLAGVGHWIRHASPGTHVIGVCAAEAPAMERSWRLGRPVTTETAHTIADGIAVRVPVPEALDDLRGVVDDILLVSEDDLRHASGAALDALGLVVEPAGAAALAAAFAHRGRFANQLVALPLCGGNVRGTATN